MVGISISAHYLMRIPYHHTYSLSGSQTLLRGGVCRRSELNRRAAQRPRGHAFSQQGQGYCKHSVGPRRHQIAWTWPLAAKARFPAILEALQI